VKDGALSVFHKTTPYMYGEKCSRVRHKVASKSAQIIVKYWYPKSVEIEGTNVEIEGTKTFFVPKPALIVCTGIAF